MIHAHLLEAGMAIAEADLNLGDRVVYPNQGVCRVVGTIEMEISGHREVFTKLSREEDDAAVLVPQGRANKIGLRKVANASEIEEVFSYLSTPIEGLELDWKIRHRVHGEKMNEGGLIDLAQVVKSLAALSVLRVLPTKERELYDNARHLLVCEISASTGMSAACAEDAVDFSLFPPGEKKIILSNKIEKVFADDEDINDFALDDELTSGEIEKDLFEELSDEATDSPSHSPEKKTSPKKERSTASRSTSPKKTDSPKKTQAKAKTAKPVKTKTATKRTTTAAKKSPSRSKTQSSREK
jgi:RNA polymerase-interacting CarD/CdnL/TRCF family regulator